MSKKWINLKEIGMLFIEIVLIQFDIPLLFVCNDSIGNRYLVLCVDEEYGEYIAILAGVDLLINMLTNKISMDMAFKQSKDKNVIYISYDFTNKCFVMKKGKSKEIPENYLPDAGACFEISNDKITKYIENIKIYSISINQEINIYYSKFKFEKVVQLTVDSFYGHIFDENKVIKINRIRKISQHKIVDNIVEKDELENELNFSNMNNKNTMEGCICQLAVY